MTEPSRVLVTGATGLVGGRLAKSLIADRVAVRALTRNPDRARSGIDPGVELREWDGLRVPAPVVRGVDAIVHLAGEPVFAGRLTTARRTRIRDSRVDSTRSLVETVDALAPGERPRVLVCASAVGIYGSRGEEPLPETSAPGHGFLSEVCREWEQAAASARPSGVRVVSLRIGIVLAAEGGALPRMAAPFRFGLGGNLGSGRQWFPWIHVDDLVSSMRTALRDESLTGPVNAVSPKPVRNAELTRALARVLRRPAIFRVPERVLRLALGELSDELLGSRRVIPQRLNERGFTFAHPDIEGALSRELSR